MIGAIVLDFGNNAGDSSASASLDVDVDSDAVLTIEHTGGDSINLQQTEVIVDDGTNTDTYAPATSAATFSVGDVGEIDAGDGTATTSADLGDLVDTDPSGLAETSGTQLTVTFIDTENNRQIYKTTVTVP